MRRRGWLQAATLGASGLACWLTQASQAPRRLALLIGVGELPQQPPQLWLKGPRQDVAGMAQALQAQGFTQIQQLDDASAPSRTAILQALRALVAQVQPGDAVLLYWSGHGVQASSRHGERHTFLLARDCVRAGADSLWPLRGAVADAELGACIDDCLQAGAHVLAVLDVCHAASATRSETDPGWAWRGLRVADLEQLRPGSGSILSPRSPALPPVLPQARPRHAGFVGFYACEEMQRTPEWQLDGVYQGAFTYALLQGLRGRPTGYSAWARATLQRHQALAQRSSVALSRWPSPVFEGSLQADLWTRASLPQWAAPSQSIRPLRLPAGLQVLLRLRSPGQGWQVLDLGQLSAAGLDLGRLPVGTQLELQLRHSGPQALYLRIFHTSVDQRWEPLYPALAGDAARLPAGSAAQPAFWQRALVIDQAEVQAEGLHWIVAPAMPEQLIRDGVAAQWPAQAWQAWVRWQAVAAD